MAMTAAMLEGEVMDENDRTEIAMRENETSDNRTGLLDPRYAWIDWEQIAADAEEDDRLGVKPAFDSSMYPDHETAMKAMRERIHRIFVEVMDGIAAASSLDIARRA